MLTFVLALLMATPLPAKPDRYVTDRAGVLDVSRASALNEKLAAFERQTSDQILVYVDKRLPEGTTLEEMSAQAIKTWGIGQKEKDNGAILFIFTDDRKMRIEVGYGLEGSLTDFQAKRILSQIIRPHLQHGDFTGGVEDGVEAILRTVRGEPYRGPGITTAETTRRPIDDIETLRKNLGIGLVVLPLILLAFALLWKMFRQPRVDETEARAKRRARTGWQPEADRRPSTVSSWLSSDSSSTSSSNSSSSSSPAPSSSLSGGGGSGGGGGASDSW